MARDEAYRLAERKIKEARTSGATRLDLAGMGLSEVPEAIGQLTQLRELSLSRNQLTALPEAIGKLTQLRQLYVFGNRLAALPEAIGKLTQLQVLELSGNQLTALPEAIGQLTQLRELCLPDNELTAFPEAIGKLTQLQELQLGGNRLAAVPEAIGKLTNLRVLGLSNNRLTALPEAIGKLTQLQEFWLCGNQLTALPEAIGQLTQLQLLSLYNNRLTALPEAIGQLTALRGLFLHGNSRLGLPQDLLGPSLLEVWPWDKRVADPRGILAFYFGQRMASAKPLNEVKATRQEVEGPEASAPKGGPLPLFICYARADKRFAKQLTPSLKVLARRGYIAPWRDTDLVPGEDWDDTIKGRLSNAKIILFMVSTDFLASDYVTEHERPLAMRLMEDDKATVVPILLAPCSWQHEDFARLENLPRKGEYVSSFSPQAKAWALVEEGIKKAAERARGMALLRRQAESQTSSRTLIAGPHAEGERGWGSFPRGRGS